MPEISVSGLKLFSSLAGELLAKVMNELTNVAAIDGTNPNALSVLLVKPGSPDSLPLSEEQKDVMLHALVFGVVPGPDGYWVTFFPQKVDEFVLQPDTVQEGKQ